MAFALAATAGAQTALPISGALILAAGGVVDLSAAAKPAAGTYVLATAAGGIGGPVPTVNLPSGVTGTLSISGNNLQLAVTVAGYASWASNHGLTSANNGLLQNPAGDGISNLMKYALGLDPLVAEGAPGTYNGNVVSFTKGSDAVTAGDVTYGIETSTDLVTWTAVTPDTNDATTISYTLPGGQGTIFARLVVTQP